MAIIDEPPLTQAEKDAIKAHRFSVCEPGRIEIVQEMRDVIPEPYRSPDGVYEGERVHIAHAYFPHLFDSATFAAAAKWVKENLGPLNPGRP